MGLTVRELALRMSAQEFGQHMLLEAVESPNATRVVWPDPDTPVAEEKPAVSDPTVAEIMASAKAAGMV